MRRGREEREALPSLYDLWRLGSRFSLGQEQKFIASTRATHGYQKLQVSPRFRPKGSGSRKLRVREVFVELSWDVAHTSRGREPSYSGLFSI